MAMESLHDLMVEELRDLYNAEKQLLKALPKMAKAATHPKLKKGFETHLKETEGQIERLDRVFEILGERATGKRCKAMEGLIEEGSELLEEEGKIPSEVMDAALIAAAQKVEHYEIGSYGTVATYADMLGHDEIAELVKETLAEEEATDEKLSALAESEINEMAMAGDMEED
jgi:ferritin-like metal-binding protein YciE